MKMETRVHSFPGNSSDAENEGHLCRGVRYRLTTHATNGVPSGDGGHGPLSSAVFWVACDSGADLALPQGIWHRCGEQEVTGILSDILTKE